MKANAIVFAWDRSVPGRERESAQHFQEFSAFLADAQRKGTIESFEAVLIEATGGKVNGFFLIRGDGDKLDDFAGSDGWVRNISRALLHIQTPLVARAYQGPVLAERMQTWAGLIPKD